MVQDGAVASPTADWRFLPQEEQPTCPNCAKALIPRGKRKRRLQGSGGREVELSRSYGTCPSCGMGLFPAFMRSLDFRGEFDADARGASRALSHMDAICACG